MTDRACSARRSGLTGVKTMLQTYSSPLRVEDDSRSSPDRACSPRRSKPDDVQISELFDAPNPIVAAASRRRLALRTGPRLVPRRSSLILSTGWNYSMLQTSLLRLRVGDDSRSVLLLTLSPNFAAELWMEHRLPRLLPVSAQTKFGSVRRRYSVGLGCDPPHESL